MGVLLEFGLSVFIHVYVAVHKYFSLKGDLIMQLWDFLTMYARISKDPCTEFWGKNVHTQELICRWPVFDWQISTCEHQILHTNHLFQVAPGSFERYHHMTISGEHFVAEAHVLNPTWGRFQLTNRDKFERMLSGDRYHLNHVGDLSEWHSALVHWALLT